MQNWTYSLKYSLRSLVREALRNVWGRTFVYPRLVANERSPERLRDYVARRAARVGVPLDGDAETLVAPRAGDRHADQGGSAPASGTPGAPARARFMDPHHDPHQRHVRLAA